MAETASPSKVRSTLRALRHRNFQLFFAGQLISLIGTWMQNVAQSWLVYGLTGSSALLGLVGFAVSLPALFVLALVALTPRPQPPPQGRDPAPHLCHDPGLHSRGAHVERAGASLAHLR